MKRYKRIDLLRVISCISVLLYHLGLLNGGYLAVCIFFTLSAYLGTVSILKNNNFDIKKYYLSRLKKIYLPLLIVVFTTIGITLFTSIKWISFKEEVTSILFGYNNFWQLNANLDYFARHIASPFMHLWYISILIQIDILLPLIVLTLKKILKKVNKYIPFIILILLSITSYIYFYITSSNIMFAYYNTLTRSYSIFLGILLGFIHYKYKPVIISNKYNDIIQVLYYILLLGMFITIDFTSNYYSICMLITSIISMRLIDYSVLNNSKITEFDRYILSISKITYELYLVQYPVIFLFQNIEILLVFKIMIILVLIILLSCILKEILNLRVGYRLSVIGRLIIIVIISLSIIGFINYIISKDYSSEMKELENKLNDNLKLIEEKNSKYINKVEEEEKEWNSILESLEEDESKIKDMVTNLSVVGVGDSVFLDAIDVLYARFPNGYFDGKISRTVYGGIDVLVNLKNEGKLGNIVILGLSTNGIYNESRNQELMSILEDREVYWINSVGADDPTFNSKFLEFSKKYKNIHIVDWEKHSSGHPEYFYRDGIHTRPSGINAYVDVIYDTIYNRYLNEYESKKNTIIKEHESELKTKVTFYGNDLLTNAYTYLSSNYNDSSFNTVNDFDTLYNKLNSKIKDNTLEYKIVLLFDKNTIIDYNKLLELSKNHIFYIVNISNSEIPISDNIKVINFNIEKEYLLKDKIHLSDIGNKKLVEEIINAI